MIAFNTTPSEGLKDFIREIRFRHFLCKDPEKMPFKPYPPKPEQCITFYPRGNEIYQHQHNAQKHTTASAVLTGQYTERINRYVSQEFLMITVVFRPGMLHRLTGIPMQELVNKQIDLEAVFPEETRAVVSRLNSSDSSKEMINHIETYIFSLIRKTKKEETPSDGVFQLLLNTPGRYSLDWLAAQAYLSPRQLERKFQHYIGVSPKLFNRIVRFDQSFRLRLKNTDEDWLGIAMACGYHDYQHMAKEYKEFVNASPNQFFTQEENAPGRILGLTKPSVFNWLRK